MKKVPVSKPEVPIQAQFAAALVKKNLQNLADRLKDGQVLTPKQLAMLESVSAVQQPPSYDSLKAAAAGMSLPVATIKAAKTAGCPAFKHGRIFPDILARWLEQNPIEAGNLVVTRESVTVRKLLASAEREELRAKKEKGEVIEVAIVKAAISAIAAEWNSLRVRFENEWPPRLVGIDVAVCRTHVREMMTDIGGVLHGLGHHFED